MVITEAPTPAAAQEAINGRLYRNTDLVRVYAQTKLLPAEAAALVRYRDDIQGRRVLDLGCGAGRLAIYLRPHTEGYVGADVSSHMVAHCHRVFEEFPFVQADMRSLTPFDSGSFHVVFAVSNLLDAVSHEDRLQVLAEARRVLSPRGLLIFSSHNRDYLHAGAAPRWRFHRNPITQLRLFFDDLQARANHRRIKPFHRLEPEYALLNDSGNNYRSLHYYISRDVQAEQLANAGFELLECLDELGRTLDPTEQDRADQSILYVARRSEYYSARSQFLSLSRPLRGRGLG
jgi:SAM-dependent methyltransferase